MKYYILLFALIIAGCSTQPTLSKKEKVVNKQLQAVFFEFNSSELNDLAKQVIAENSQVMISHPNYIFTIEGHADPIGKASYNRSLALERAVMVRQELISNGVPAEQLRINSVGESNPVLNTTLLDKTDINRRVEFIPERRLPTSQRVNTLRRANF